VGLGVLATAFGLRTGLDIVGPMLLVLAFATIAVAVLAGRRPSSAAASRVGAVATSPTSSVSID
jgi:hypothetical protein